MIDGSVEATARVGAETNPAATALTPAIIASRRPTCIAVDENFDVFAVATLNEMRSADTVTMERMDSNSFIVDNVRVASVKSFCEGLRETFNKILSSKKNLADLSSSLFFCQRPQFD